MKRIEYRVTYTLNGEEIDATTASVTARDLNSGFRRAVAVALRGLPKGWELYRVEFWRVTS